MQAAFQYLETHQARFIQELETYLKFPSISAQPAHRPDLIRCAEWLAAHCQQIGLRARVVPTPANPVVLAETPRHRTTRKPHFVVYGHYDVQPPDPLELWTSKPFEPVIREGAIYARGASDNKGQHWAHLKAVEACLKTGTELPCDLTFLFEGEEEVGGDSLPGFLAQNRKALQCQNVVVSDNGIPSLTLPALTYSLRGIVAFEITLSGPNRDLHSGIYGGAVENPAMALAQMLAQLRDRRGRIRIPGFYDEVLPLSRKEREDLRRLPYHQREFEKFLGVRALFGERGFTAQEQRTARPTFEINGLTGGYQGVGSKTIIPAWAKAKVTMRLVPNQQPATVRRRVFQHLRKICPPTVRLEIEPGHEGEPYLLSPENACVAPALRALQQAFGHKPVLMREGGSIPVVNHFKKILGADTLLLGLALPDDNPHSPNEKFDLECFRLGARLSLALWKELAVIA